MTFAAYWQARFYLGRWRRARKAHECGNARGSGFFRQGCVATGQIESGALYFDTQDDSRGGAFHYDRLCADCANMDAGEDGRSSSGPSGTVSRSGEKVTEARGVAPLQPGDRRDSAHVHSAQAPVAAPSTPDAFPTPATTTGNAHIPALNLDSDAAAVDAAPLVQIARDTDDDAAHVLQALGS